jgi:predicted dinucleotide-binding enzyme
VLLAVPGGAIAGALAKLGGSKARWSSTPRTSTASKRPTGFPSNAQFVTSKTNRPTAKSFNVNFASLYPQLGEARARLGNLWCGDAETREVVEQLNRDAGYDPINAGPIENAALQEGMVRIVFAINARLRVPEAGEAWLLAP